MDVKTTITTGEADRVERCCQSILVCAMWVFKLLKGVRKDVTYVT